MAEFERPRPQAMSDAELARALQRFPSDAKGIEAAGKLIADEQQLRMKDSQELQSWIEHLRARDDEQSKKILSESLARIFPAEPIDVVAEHTEPPALLTSELPLITRRGRVSARLRNRQYVENAVIALLLVAANTLVLHWLGFSGLTALLVVVSGVGLAMVLSTPLRTHALHPMLRAAAVFGGHGVYLFGGLALSLVSLLYLMAFSGFSEVYALADLGPFSAVAVAAVAGSALIGQLLPPRLGVVAVGLTALVAIYFLLSEEGSLGSWNSLQVGWLWGVASCALVSIVILVFGTKHTPLRVGGSLTLWAAVSVGTLSLSILVPGNLEFSMAAIITALMIAASFAGRDLAGGALGRFAGLAIVIGLLLSPLLPTLVGPAVAVISASAALMLLDQLFRSSPLHIASLDTSFGFYGSFSATGWGALLLAGFAGTTFFTSYLPQALNNLEWALVCGLILGLLFGLVRAPIIARQDREIRNLDSASGNLENLLGL